MIVSCVCTKSLSSSNESREPRLMICGFSEGYSSSSLPSSTSFASMVRSWLSTSIHAHLQILEGTPPLVLSTTCVFYCSTSLGTTIGPHDWITSWPSSLYKNVALVVESSSTMTSDPKNWVPMMEGIAVDIPQATKA